MRVSADTRQPRTGVVDEPGRSTATLFSAMLERRRRVRVDSWWQDSLKAVAWLVAVAAIAFFLASGAMVWTVGADAVTAAGRLVGIVAMILMLIQVMLSSRAPWIEGALGHDKALRLHGRLGEPVFYLLLAHVALLTIGHGAPAGRDFVAQTAFYLDNGSDIALAVLSMALLLIVGLTSIAAIRRRWPYETWHAVHLFAYAAVGLAVPHMLVSGSTFRFNPYARVFLVSLYVVAFGSLVIWRFGVPAYRAIRHRLIVLDVTREVDGSTTLTITGRHLDDWYARPGQFYLWRFYTPQLWLSSHPYSLSAAPDGKVLRITVKPLGDDSTRTGDIRPGTRVSASGPYGRFTHDVRVGRGLVLIGAGVGVAPIRSMLEDRRAADGPCNVVLRGRTLDAIPLVDEFRELTAAQGARLHVVLGQRGQGWSSLDGPPSLAHIVPDLKTCDVFVCGTGDWSKAVVRDALASGVPREAIHVEEYEW